MIFLDELQPMKLYKKPFHLPINEKDKRKGSVSFLLTPNYQSSIELMKNPLMINRKYYESYYIEKDITYFINQEGYLEDISDESYRDVINEDNRIFISKKIDNDIINEAIFNKKDKSKSRLDELNKIKDKGISSFEYKSKIASKIQKYIKEIQNKILIYSKSFDNVKYDIHEIHDNDIKSLDELNSKDFIMKKITLVDWSCDDANTEDKYRNKVIYIAKQIISKDNDFVIIENIDSIGLSYKKYIYDESKINKQIERLESILNEASNEVLNDPKRLAKSLKLRMNKPKYKLNKISDQERNNIGVEKDSHLNSNGVAGTENQTNKTIDKMEESYKVQEGSYYCKKCMTVSAIDDIEKGEIIDVIGSELDNIQGPSRDGWNVVIKDGKYIASEKILKGSMMYCLGKTDALIESTEALEQIEKEYIGQDHREFSVSESHMRCKVDGRDIIFAFNENLDEQVLNEASTESTKLHKLLYKERFRNNKQIFNIYDDVKRDVPYVRRTFLNYERYKQFNLFVDLSFYNQTFFKNNIYKLDRGVQLYFDFINRFIQDKRLENAGYTKKTVFIPVMDWTKPEVSIYKYSEDINPISIILRLMKTDSTRLQEWKGIDFIFLTTKGYFKVDFSNLETSDTTKFNLLIDRLIKGDPIVDDIEPTKESPKAIVANIVDKIEDSQKIKINNLTGDSGEIDKDELVKKIEKAAATSSSTDEAIDTLEEDDFIKNILTSLASEEDDSVKINNARAARINKLNDEFLNKKLNNVTVRDMIENKEGDKELPVKELEIDSVNEEWKQLQYVNFEEVYDPQEDIVAALYSLSKKTVPVMVRDLQVEDASNSEDMILTYTVQLEDVHGERFTIKFDVPKLKDNKFCRLRGNDKTFNGQLVQIPIAKVDEDTVQIVSNYKKTLISRYGTTTGKSYVVADRIIKTINKMESKQIKITIGDNTKVCSKYELPIDYIDLSSQYSKLEFGEYIILFNQDELRDKYSIDEKKGIPIGINAKDKSVLYYDGGEFKTFSDYLWAMLAATSSEFAQIYETTNTSTRYTYSKASILNNHIPVIIIMGYSEGLLKALKKANVKYELVEKRPKINKSTSDIIKFKDGYLVYELDYNSSLLLNGLKECNTEDFSLSEVNNKSMWLEFLDLFGGKILADGLDNFYDLMIDPITQEILEYYKLPTDYVEIFAYANYLLSDNKYFKHTDMSARRYRSNEIIAGYTYQAIADSYGDYRRELKRGKKAKMTIKKTEVIDRILLDPTTSDFSILNPLLEIEAINSVTYKGLVGMNNDRAYSLDKRTFDDSMVNVLGLSTGFAGNVGITRQATIDMNIKGKRGYIKTTNDVENMNVAKTFTATEALTPFGSRRDDPFRSAMTFIQTAKHGMRVKTSMPMLISNGMDQALPYMITNTFAFKAREDGKIIEKTDQYIILEYKDGSKDFIDLRELVQKNSDGGFYLTLKLDSDYKVGAKFKKGEVLAYDKYSFSDTVGHNDDIAYNIGTLAKVALLNTDEGFEDSAIISSWLSEAMASDIVVKKDVSLPKNTNIYNMVKKGQPIQEGDPLMIFQNAFEEDDVNILLKNLVDDEELISELGRIPIKSKVTGTVENIKISRTVEKDELSDSLKKKTNELEKEVSDLKKIMKKYDIEYHDRFEADYKLDATGKLKNVDEGVLIEFFLKYEDKLSVGDKIIYYSALKGVVKDIFPEGKEPYTDFRPDEKVHSLLSLGSVNGRMVTSVMMVGSINKVLIELDRKVKDMLGIPFKYLDEE